MHGVIGSQEVLVARDSAKGASPEQELAIFMPEGRTITTTARMRLTFDHCVDHFVAHGVCVECTRKTGHIVSAS